MSALNAIADVHEFRMMPRMALAVRPLSTEERTLVCYLWDLSAADNALPPELLVKEMHDGSMGSLSFVSAKPERSFGRIAGNCSFLDDDGVLVDAALILDEEGDLFEVDIWKSNFDPLIRIPDALCFSPPCKQTDGSCLSSAAIHGMDDVAL